MKLRRSTSATRPAANGKAPSPASPGGAGAGTAVVETEEAEVPRDLAVAKGGRRLGEILLAHDVAEEAVVRALAIQSTGGKKLGQALLELDVIDERTLTRALAEQADLPVLDLSDATVHAEALALIPESVARSAQAIPLSVDDEGLRVAVADPSPEVIERVVLAAGDTVVRFEVADASAVTFLIDREYKALASVGSHIAALQSAGHLKQVEELAKDAAKDSATDDAPVVQIAQLILTQALRDRASDIHIEPQESRVRVRYRIDGVLLEVLSLPVQVGPALVSRIKIMAGMNIVERRRAQDGQIATEIDGRALDIRVATAATIWGEKAVLRLLDKSRDLFRLPDLGMPDDLAATYRRLVRSPFGMVVCTGPTGSGKTTSLYATLGEINAADMNVITIEDPVEYVLPAVNQIQINEQAGISFAATLRSTLRQDPDVILVGEIRDAETASISVRAALTGHLVLSSLHATDAASAINRFLDMGVEPFLISSSLLGVVAQRLVRRNCAHCSTRYKPTAEELAFYKQAGGTKKTAFTAGKGCNLCNHTGFQDRVGVYEVLPITDRIRELTIARAPREEIRDAAVAEGMRTLRDEGVRLVDEGTTTIAEVIRNIYLI